MMDRNSWETEHRCNIGPLYKDDGDRWWKWAKDTDHDLLEKTYAKISRMSLENPHRTWKLGAVIALYEQMRPLASRLKHEAGPTPCNDRCRGTGLVYVIYGGESAERARIQRRGTDLSGLEYLSTGAVPCICNKGLDFEGAQDNDLHRRIFREYTYEMSFGVDKVIEEARKGQKTEAEKQAEKEALEADPLYNWVRRWAARIAKGDRRALRLLDKPADPDRVSETQRGHGENWL